MKYIFLRFQKKEHLLIASIVMACFFVLSTTKAYAQYKIPEVPKNQTSVYDYINLFSPAEKTTLE